MATKSVKEMMGMFPQMTPEMMAGPTEMLKETAKVLTRSMELAQEMTGKLGDELWSRSMKSYDESQKLYRTNLETLHNWTETWQTQALQNVQRLMEMTQTSWK